MQQTEKYKLNLIETSDPFSPAPLNENADKTEAALDTLDGRVTMLEARKVVVGSFRGNGSTQTIELGFTPIFVLVANYNVTASRAIATPQWPAWGTENSTNYKCVTVVEGGFYLRLAGNINSNLTDYIYLAIG